MVSLRELITYAITYSDNSAHEMLYDYIGRDNLKNYGNSLGAKYIMTGGDHYGNQTVDDTMIYLKEAYNIIINNEEYGPYLKDIMMNTDNNRLNFEEINNVAHKYGSYGGFNHDIGIAFEDNPYYISVLTISSDYKCVEVIKDIHKKINELHQLFHLEREERCYNIIYGE